jgi:alkylation response protein AidB-like acyl-CoA dehydrogenase
MTGATAVIDLPARAKAVGTLADEHAAEGDEQGFLSAPVVEAFHREGLLGMWVPKTIRGGAELDPVSSLQLLEHVSYGDPSAGWVLMAASLAIGTGAAFLGDAAVDELFGGDRLPVIAGQGTRPGLGVPQAGGFSLTGSWSFASGIKHSTHIHTLGLVDGTNEPRIFVLPVGKATLIENWDVLGLRATGSIDYRINHVFVPEAYTHRAASQTPLRGGPLFNIAVMGFAVLCHSGWACGIGRRLLDELTARVRGGVGRTGTLASSDAFHEQYAKAEGTYRAAKAFIYETWGEVNDTLERGDRLSVRQHTMIRLALTHATWACHDIAQFVYTTAGTVALRAGAIQRLFRDMHAGTQHITSAPPVVRNTGRELAGLAPGKSWIFLDLIDQP